mmetsp:Transcript_20027/g.43090  ORF Transcript_20027/g.43090 Transcript_20027/m.43090 type:complete len:650 (+) Transcript_20027:2-1951(+)
MGKEKDIYMRFVNNGDAFVGRTLTLLPLLDAEFGSSSPHFHNPLTGVEPDFKERLIETHFPMFKRVSHFGRMKEMLMASLLYHKSDLQNLPNNHCILMRADFVRNQSVMRWLERNPTAIRVALPWERKDEDFHGIPGSIKALHEMASIKMGQTKLVSDFCEKFTAILSDNGIGSGPQSVESFRNMTREELKEIRERLNRLDTAPQDLTNEDAADTTPQLDGPAAQDAAYRYHGRNQTRLPDSFRFPRCGMYSLWKQWWLGDSNNGVPPLRTLDAKDFKWLDDLPLTPEEMHGRTGPNKHKRRPSSKVLSDMKALCLFIQCNARESVQTELRSPDSLTTELVYSVFESTYPLLLALLEEQGVKGNWRTVVGNLRRKGRMPRGNDKTLTQTEEEKRQVQQIEASLQMNQHSFENENAENDAAILRQENNNNNNNNASGGRRRRRAQETPGAQRQRRRASGGTTRHNHDETQQHDGTHQQQRRDGSPTIGMAEFQLDRGTVERLTQEANERATAMEPLVIQQHNDEARRLARQDGLYTVGGDVSTIRTARTQPPVRRTTSILNSRLSERDARQYNRRLSDEDWRMIREGSHEAKGWYSINADGIRWVRPRRQQLVEQNNNAPAAAGLDATGRAASMRESEEFMNALEDLAAS